MVVEVGLLGPQRHTEHAFLEIIEVWRSAPLSVMW